jgi:6-pyruvoyltetrahydropterin/6-carboxytetrahydropterin synthase
MENIAMVIWNILRKELDRDLDIIIKLHETENNCVEYPSVI